jgi:leucine-rich PPR motif-containing protein
VKGFVRRHYLLLERGNNPETSLSRSFSGASHHHHYRERLRNELHCIKFDDAFSLFCEMLQSRPIPSIVDFTRVLTVIAKMNKFDIVIYLYHKMENLGISHDL